MDNQNNYQRWGTRNNRSLLSDTANIPHRVLHFFRIPPEPQADVIILQAADTDLPQAREVIPEQPHNERLPIATLLMPEPIIRRMPVAKLMTIPQATVRSVPTLHQAAIKIQALGRGGIVRQNNIRTKGRTVI